MRNQTNLDPPIPTRSPAAHKHFLRQLDIAKGFGLSVEPGSIGRWFATLEAECMDDALDIVAGREPPPVEVVRAPPPGEGGTPAPPPPPGRMARRFEGGG